MGIALRDYDRNASDLINAVIQRRVEKGYDR